MNDSGFGEMAGVPIRDAMTGEVVRDADDRPVFELESHDYLELMAGRSIEEREAGERAWRFGHVIVDEAQDLTPMQWRMVARRARGRSMTLVGDLAQRSSGAVASWSDLIPRDLGPVATFELTTNYRSPAEVASLSARMLAELAPDLTPPSPIRESGHPPRFEPAADVEATARRVAAELGEGRVGVIGLDPPEIDAPNITALTPTGAKGMEFDAVVVIEPAAILEEPNGLSLLYVAVTRTTDRLVVAHDRPLPPYFCE